MNSDNKIINKLFYKPCWGLAWRYSDCNHSDLTQASQFKFFNIIPPAKYYYADPFLVTDKNKITWLFVELMDRAREIGSIAVSKFDSKSFGEFTEIIKEPFHMSFPNVFRYDDSWFMIPETCAAKQLRLYKAEKFPYEWKLDTVLLDNVNLVDSCFLETGKDMTAFQEYEWFRNINQLRNMKFANINLYKWIYFVVFENDIPLIIAPLEIWKVGISYKKYGHRKGCYFIGREGYSDYLNFIYKIFSEEAIETLIKYIGEKYKCNYFHLDQMKTGTDSFRYFEKRYNINSIDIACAALRLPDSFEEYKKYLSKNVRQNIRTAINRQKKNDLIFTHEIVYEIDDDIKDKLMEIRQQRLGAKQKKTSSKASWKGKLYNGFFNSLHKKFYLPQDVIHQACNEWAFLVKKDERIIAYYWGIRNKIKKEYYVILAGVDEEYAWYSPCISHLYLFLEEYYNENKNDIKVLDFTRGGERYKHDLGCEIVPMKTIYFFV